MSTTTAPAISILTNYTQDEENTLAGTLSSSASGAKVIYNTTLSKARIWDGNAFTDAPAGSGGTGLSQVQVQTIAFMRT